MSSGGATVRTIAKKQIPGPDGHLILGNLPDIRRDRLGFLTKTARQYGTVVQFRIGPTNMILVANPEGVQHILQSNNQNYTKDSIGFATLRDLIGNGLLLSEGDFWLRQRRLMQPAFHHRKIKVFGEMIVEETRRMLDSWESQAASGRPLNVAREMMRLTLSVITRALFSDRVGDESGAIGDSITWLLEDSIYRFDHPLYPPYWVPTPRNLRYRQAKAALQAVIDAIIERRRSDPTPHDDLLEMLMQATDEESGERMSDEQLRQEMITLFIAGHETTAVLLSWTFYALARNPEIRERMQAELSTALAGRDPQETDLKDLPYTRMILDESLRLYPPVWGTDRKSIGEDEISGYVIPANTEVFVSPFITQRDPELWPEPEKFDPERFTPENSLDRHRFAYFPFGGGPRLCIGNNFALMEAQLILATISQRYNLELAPGRTVELEPLITMRPKDGLWIQLQEV